MERATGPLAGLVVLDLTRILAGPTATQLFGDLGADVIKIERASVGDDTRGWGPPFLKDADGNDTAESAYYMCANRNKRSVALDIAASDGQAIVRRLAEQADFVFENFKVGALAKYSLDYASLSAINPRLIYCSITGFGQTGPLKDRAGYDFMAQGRGGIMSVTGFPDEEGGQPVKVGVGIADVMCGMYAATAALAALNARKATGRGQYIDLALFDSQLAWLINQGVAYLMTGIPPGRLGNGHPTIVPYDTFEAADRLIILAIGNDAQFRRFCREAGREELADDPRFATNRARVVNRHELTPIMNELTRRRTAEEWDRALEPLGVPCGPINDFQQAFADPQAVHRGMRVSVPHPASPSGTVDLIGNPIKLTDTPVAYRQAPPMRGEHTREVLAEKLGMEEAEIARLAEAGVADLGDRRGDAERAA